MSKVLISLSFHMFLLLLCFRDGSVACGTGQSGVGWASRVWDGPVACGMGQLRVGWISQVQLHGQPYQLT